MSEINLSDLNAKDIVFISNEVIACFTTIRDHFLSTSEPICEEKEEQIRETLFDFQLVEKARRRKGPKGPIGPRSYFSWRGGPARISDIRKAIGVYSGIDISTVELKRKLVYEYKVNLSHEGSHYTLIQPADIERLNVVYRFLSPSYVNKHI